jgi:hypothetical protein
LAALRAPRESRTDVEALDLTAVRLRHLGEAFTAAADQARATMNHCAHRDPAERPHPVREDDQGWKSARNPSRSRTAAIEIARTSPSDYVSSPAQPYSVGGFTAQTTYRK